MNQINKISLSALKSIEDFKLLTSEHNSSDYDPNIEIFFDQNKFQATKKFTLGLWNNPLKKAAILRGQIIKEDGQFYLTYRSQISLSHSLSLIVIILIWIFFIYSFFTNEFGFIGGVIAAPIAFIIVFYLGIHEKKILEKCLIQLSKKIV